VNDEIHAPMRGVRDSGWGRTPPDSLKEVQDLIWINSHNGHRQYPISAAMRHRPSPRENTMSNTLRGLALDQLFRTARTRNAWTDRPVTEQQLRELYDLMKFGPTSGNCCPARFVWVRSAEGKSKLAALAAPTNASKILAAPVTVIVGYDLDFAEQLPKLFPARGKDMQAYYSDPLVAQTTAFRNSSLQGAYLIISARALGLDCGPMSGFSTEAVDSEFFANTRIKSNFICSIGYGSNENLFPRNPRLTFEEAGRFA
jgi:3-hydroxypropanoate dehydrogenase